MERRTRRSERPGEAAHFYLEAVRQRTGLKGVALANEDGLLVAGAGEELEWLAAVGASCKRPTLELGARTVHVQALRVRSDEQVYLAASGPTAPSAEVASGLSRIFAA